MSPFEKMNNHCQRLNILVSLLAMLVIVSGIIMIPITDANPLDANTRGECRFSKGTYFYGEIVTLFISTDTGIWNAYIIIVKPDGSSNIITFGKLTPGSYVFPLGQAGPPPGYRQAILKDREYGDRTLSQCGYYVEAADIVTEVTTITRTRTKTETQVITVCTKKHTEYVTLTSTTTITITKKVTGETRTTTTTITITETTTTIITTIVTEGAEIYAVVEHDNPLIGVKTLDLSEGLMGLLQRFHKILISLLTFLGVLIFWKSKEV